MVVCTYQVVAGRLTGAVRTIGFVAVVFGKGRIPSAQRPIDLVGRHVQQTECRFLIPSKRSPVGSDLFQ